MSGDSEVEAAAGHDVRRFIHGAHGQDYVAYDTYRDAKDAPDAAVVLSGDFGGVVYLTAPMHLVGCDEEALHTLLSDLDAMTFMGGNAYGASVAYEQRRAPSGVWGGQGGGVVIDGIWTHPRWLDDEVATYARQVIDGTRTRLPGRVLRERRAARIQEVREMRRDSLSRLAWDFDILDPVVPFPDDETESGTM